jgi:hypothetical protein
MSFVFDTLRLQQSTSSIDYVFPLQGRLITELTADIEPMLSSRLDLHRPLRVTRKGELTAWLDRAQPGNRVVYHLGFLAVDRSCTSSLNEGERRHLDALATAAGSAAAAGIVHLVQERLAAGTFRYLAVRALQKRGSRNSRRAAWHLPSATDERDR